MILPVNPLQISLAKFSLLQLNQVTYQLKISKYPLNKASLNEPSENCYLGLYHHS